MGTRAELLKKCRHFSSTFIYRSAHFLFEKFIKAKSVQEDKKRRELILNIILFAVIILLIIVNLNNFYRIFHHPDFGGFGATSPILILGVFVFLYFLSKKGKFIWASFILLAIYFAAVTSGSYYWGVFLPEMILSYAVIIIMSSILINTRFSFLITAITIITVISLSYLQLNDLSSHKVYWSSYQFRMNDGIVFCITYILVVTIAWLSNREIEKSLHRARRSEAELKRERDLLEVKVEERTRELKRMQVEKMSQLYRFAEFGRLSSGLFHDLINPLTAVSISVRKLAEIKGQNLEEAQSYLDGSIAAARRMENFIRAIRKQLSHQETKISFSLNEEIHQVMQLLDFKARKANVELNFVRQHEVQAFGSPVKFHQMLSNLVANAIDAYDDMPAQDNGKRAVEIRLAENHHIVRLEVQDWGCGIAPDILEKIFDPFFTTKNLEKGTGIGLSTTKNIVEKDFGGNICVKSLPVQGSTFTVEFTA